MEERLVPELRFPEFKGEWKKKRLNDIAKVNPRSEVPEEFLYIDLESVDNGNLTKNLETISQKNAPSRAQRLLEYGDILYSTVRPYQRNNYLFEDAFPTSVVASTGYAQIRTNRSKYLYYYLHTTKFVKDALRRSAGTSYPAIAASDVSSISIAVPSSGEQEKIGDFFHKMDKKLKLEQERIEALKEYKKGMMQKLFSQEIRFKDHNGNDYPEWEEMKLGELANDYNIRFKDVTEFDELLSVTLNSGIRKQSELGEADISSSDKSNYKVVKKDNVVYNTMRMWQGASGVSAYNGLVSPAYVVLRLSEAVNPGFIGYFFKIPEMIYNFFKYSQGMTSDTLTLRYNNFKEIKTLIPSNAEQTKIANFLSSIDKKIEIEEEKLERFNEMKRGLMQKMFI